MDMSTRRRGVFPTPLPFAKKAYEYIEKTLGKHWWQSGDYRLWDMAAGTGHLELFLPKDVLPYCYLSTLEQKDVQHLEKTFPSATVFQYDYLNDDVERKSGGLTPSDECQPTRLQSGGVCPPHLRNDLANPKIKWIILVNPPYATAPEAGWKGTSKEGVSDTKIRKQMHADGLGEVSRELYVQFLYRIMHEFKERETLLGLFSPLKYLISANYQKFRDNVFRDVTFQSGFVFSSENFGGTSKTSHFPVAFIVWDIGARAGGLRPPMSQSKLRLESFGTKSGGFTPPALALALDILDSTAQVIGAKTVKPTHRDDFLSRWIKRPRGTQIFPPFGSALTIKTDNIDTRNRIADGFLASLMCPGNELQNQQQTAFLSGPQASAGALSVTPDNFEQAVIVFAARRIPKDSWINHVDQLMRPNRKPSPQFVSDCAVWSLFDSKNQTVALRNVEYQGRVYRIVVNHFFPFTIDDTEPQSLDCEQIAQSKDYGSVSFIADWLAKQMLSPEANNVLTIAKKVYRFYFANLHLLRRDKFKIETYDAGWYQIRLALQDAKLAADLLADLKCQHDHLKDKILPQLYDYGILN
jgi:hypothetical protein